MTPPRDLLKSAWGRVRQVAILAAILLVAIVAYNMGASGRADAPAPRVAGPPTSRPTAQQTAAVVAPESSAPALWTCSMHPQIQLPEPGECPICGMDLIPMAPTEGAPTPHDGAPAPHEPIGYACAMNCVPPLPEPGRCPVCGMQMQPVFDEQTHAASHVDPAWRHVMSEEARALADIRTAPVGRRWLENEVRMVGTVDFDETRLAYVTAFVGGRLDRLYVDFTGTTVRAGDHLAWVYSPELLTAQEELLQAKRAREGTMATLGEEVRTASERAYLAARERLRLWGLGEEQIEAIETRGTREDHLTIYAQQGGIVLEKHVREGAYVATGDRLFTIADLSHLWVKLRAYESDLPWLRYGQDVVFTAEAFPGEEFHGRIAFIDQALDTASRSVGVRLNIENSEGRLKPGMFVRARVRSRLARGGRVIERSLADKWICPMHPEVIEDGAGECPICQMDLVTAAELGYTAEEPDAPPLAIPATAPLITGRRAVVYVAVHGAARPTYEGREIVLGPRAGDYYVVADGLTEGERVVTHGAFRIDSALQIVAKKSMMNPEGGRTAAGHAGHGEPPSDDPTSASASPTTGHQH